jgi:hypothetical protein
VDLSASFDELTNLTADLERAGAVVKHVVRDERGQIARIVERAGPADPGPILAAAQRVALDIGARADAMEPDEVRVYLGAVHRLAGAALTHDLPPSQRASWTTTFESSAP